MEISYKRELSHNYMVIQKNEAEVYQDYQADMLKRNKIEGLLKLSIRQRDDLIDLFYEISSKQPLNRFFESQKITRYEVEKLVLGIAKALENMKPYLLRAEQIYLLPECIYIEPGNMRVFLCFIPGEERDFATDLKNLLHKLLDYVDYQDKESVEQIYRLYHEVLKENFQLEDLVKCLTNDCKLEERRVSPPAIKTEGRKEPELSPGGSEVFSYFQNTSMPEAAAGLKDKSFFANLKSFLFAKRPDEEKLDAEAGFKPITDTIHKDFQYDWSYENLTGALSYVKEPEAGETVLLDYLEPNIRQVVTLKSISPLAYSDILIDTFPFIIGKGSKGIHYTINHPAVSRFHVAINKIGESFQIEDLNSLNGTKIDGKLLIANEKRVLCHGSLVEIAGMEFYFYNHHQM